MLKLLTSAISGASNASEPSARGGKILSDTLVQDRANIAAVLAASLFINLLGLTTSLYMLQIYDRVLGSYRVETLVFLTLIAAVALMAMSSLEAVRTGMLQRMGARFADKLGPATMEAQLRGAARSDAPALQPLRDLDAIRNAIGSAFTAAACDLPWSLIYFILLYWLHPILFGVTLTFCLLLVCVALLNERLNARASAATSREQLMTLQFAESAVQSAESLAAMNATTPVTTRWRTRSRKTALMGLRTLDREASLHATARFLRWMLQILLLGGGAALAIAGELSAGAIVAASIIGARAAGPVEAVIGNWRVVLLARQAWDRLATVLGARAERVDGLALPRPAGRVTADRASILIPGEQRLLISNLSFELQPGEQLAVIGPSGSGKSTLLRAVLGLIPLASGNLKLDGAEVATWRRHDLGRWTGYLPQTPLPIVGSVGENIARFEPNADEAVYAAAAEAGVDALIRSFPAGYNTPIGTGGVRLSGGQLQWIAIAAALFKAPPLVVLDEPEAHLDGDGETQLRNMLGRLRERRATVIIVSHRPSVVQVVDKVLLLREGRGEFGPRDDMMKRTLRVSGAGSKNVES